MLSPDFTDACVLFGDSITQTSAPGTFFSRMAEYYERRLDVVNRGFSGANDAVHSPGVQHVPLDQYESALRTLVSRVQRADFRTRVLLITPPPFLTEFWRAQHIAWALREGRANSPEEALHGSNRDKDTTKAYARTALSVAKETGIEAVDLMTGMPEAAGDVSENSLRPYYTDGLHLSPDGYRVVFDLVKAVIESKYPELDPTKMLASMPDYSEYEAGDIEGVIETTRQRYREQWQ